MTHSIRWRIAWPYVLLLLLTMAGLGSYLIHFARQMVMQNLRDQLTAEARLIGEALAPLLAEQPKPERLDGLAKEWAAMLGTRITLVAADGTVLGESHEDRSQMDNHLDRPEIRQALDRGQGYSVRYSKTLGADMMYVAVAVKAEGKVIGFARVSLSLKDVRADIGYLAHTLVGATLAAAILAILLAIGIAWQTTQPLHELTKAAQRFATGDLDHSLISVSKDEVGQLASMLSTMAAKLSQHIEALKVESDKLASVLQQMSDGVIIVDGQGDVLLINPAARRIFDISEDRALGHSLAEVVRHHQLVELWQNCKDSGTTQEMSLELSHKHLSLQIVARPLKQALPGNVLLLLQDVTRLRQLETVRRDFISNLSHELRTPLASLKALTETLQAGALDDPPAARRFLERMDTEVDALTQMVNELLELSRIESGKAPLDLQPTSPQDLLKRAWERLSTQAERAQLSVTIDCPPDLPMVKADPPRIEQVLVNLLHNAIKFTPPGGQITLAACQQGGVVIFSVKDSGVGIAAEDLVRIFERFYKADRARSGGGTGLGLAIARHLVESHGGHIWAESSEGQGSTFYFSIPTVN